MKLEDIGSIGQEKPEEEQEPPIRFDRNRMKSVYGICLVDSCHNTDQWPNYFCQPVKVGDLIMSANKTVLKVLEITHVYHDRDSIMLIKLGPDRGGSSPVEGGAYQVEGE